MGKIKELKAKIRTFRPQFENEGMFASEIAREIPCNGKTVRKIAKLENWAVEKRQEHRKAMPRQCLDRTKPIQVLKQEKVIIPKPTPVKTKIEHNQFKKLAPKSNIEWSDEIAPEIKIKRKVKEKDFDLMEYANKLIKEREKQNITIWKKKR